MSTSLHAHVVIAKVPHLQWILPYLAVANSAAEAAELVRSRPGATTDEIVSYGAEWPDVVAKAMGINLDAPGIARLTLNWGP